MNTCFIDDCQKKEWMRRRKLRLLQVREQSKDLAKGIRERVKEEKFQKQVKLEKEREIALQEYKKMMIDELEKKYHEAMQKVGVATRDAQSEADPESLRDAERLVFEARARNRGRSAERKAEKEAAEIKEARDAPIRRKQMTREVEDIRSALIVQTRDEAVIRQAGRQVSLEIPTAYSVQLDSDRQRPEVPHLKSSLLSTARTGSSSAKTLTDRSDSPPKRSTAAPSPGSARNTRVTISEKSPISGKHWSPKKTFVSSPRKSTRDVPSVEKLEDEPPLVEYYDSRSRYSRSYRLSDRVIGRHEIPSTDRAMPPSVGTSQKSPVSPRVNRTSPSKSSAYVRSPRNLGIARGVPSAEREKEQPEIGTFGYKSRCDQLYRPSDRVSERHFTSLGSKDEIGPFGIDGIDVLPATDVEDNGDEELNRLINKYKVVKEAEERRKQLPSAVSTTSSKPTFDSNRGQSKSTSSRTSKSGEASTKAVNFPASAKAFIVDSPPDIPSKTCRTRRKDNLASKKKSENRKLLSAIDKAIAESRRIQREASWMTLSDSSEESDSSSADNAVKVVVNVNCNNGTAQVKTSGDSKRTDVQINQKPETIKNNVEIVKKTVSTEVGESLLESAQEEEMLTKENGCQCAMSKNKSPCRCVRGGGVFEKDYGTPRLSPYKRSRTKKERKTACPCRGKPVPRKTCEVLPRSSTVEDLSSPADDIADVSSIHIFTPERVLKRKPEETHKVPVLEKVDTRETGKPVSSNTRGRDLAKKDAGVQSSRMFVDLSENSGQSNWSATEYMSLPNGRSLSSHHGSSLENNFQPNPILLQYIQQLLGMKPNEIPSSDSSSLLNQTTSTVKHPDRSSIDVSAQSCQATKEKAPEIPTERVTSKLDPNTYREETERCQRKLVEIREKLQEVRKENEAMMTSSSSSSRSSGYDTSTTSSSDSRVRNVPQKVRSVSSESGDDILKKELENRLKALSEATDKVQSQVADRWKPPPTLEDRARRFNIPDVNPPHRLSMIGEETSNLQITLSGLSETSSSSSDVIQDLIRRNLISKPFHWSQGASFSSDNSEKDDPVSKKKSSHSQEAAKSRLGKQLQKSKKLESKNLDDFDLSKELDALAKEPQRFLDDKKTKKIDTTIKLKDLSFYKPREASDIIDDSSPKHGLADVTPVEGISRSDLSRNLESLPPSKDEEPCKASKDQKRQQPPDGLDMDLIEQMENLASKTALDKSLHGYVEEALSKTADSLLSAPGDLEELLEKLNMAWAWPVLTRSKSRSDVPPTSTNSSRGSSSESTTLQ